MEMNFRDVVMIAIGLALVAFGTFALLRPAQLRDIATRQIGTPHGTLTKFNAMILQSKTTVASIRFSSALAILMGLLLLWASLASHR